MKIEQLEKKMATLVAEQRRTDVEVATTEPVVADSSVPPATSTRRINDNRFNPEIGIILQGKYQSFSQREGDFAGFAVGEEAERTPWVAHMGQVEDPGDDLHDLAVVELCDDPPLAELIERERDDRERDEETRLGRHRANEPI